MFFLNTRIISKSRGSYGNNADLNVAELKAIMKNLIVHDRPQKIQAAVWASDKKIRRRMLQLRLKEGECGRINTRKLRR